MQQINIKATYLTEKKHSKVLPFETGNFLRAFVDLMIQKLNKKNNFKAFVVLVMPTNQRNYNILKSQEGLFTIVINGFKNGNQVVEKSVVSYIQKRVNPYLNWSAYLTLAKIKDIGFIVSNTTEAGIKFNRQDKLEEYLPKDFFFQINTLVILASTRIKISSVNTKFWNLSNFIKFKK